MLAVKPVEKPVQQYSRGENKTPEHATIGRRSRTEALGTSMRPENANAQGRLKEYPVGFRKMAHGHLPPYGSVRLHELLRQNSQPVTNDTRLRNKREPISADRLPALLVHVDHTSQYGKMNFAHYCPKIQQISPSVSYSDDSWRRNCNQPLSRERYSTLQSQQPTSPLPLWRPIKVWPGKGKL